MASATVRTAVGSYGRVAGSRRALHMLCGAQKGTEREGLLSFRQHPAMAAAVAAGAAAGIATVTTLAFKRNEEERTGGVMPLFEQLLEAPRDALRRCRRFVIPVARADSTPFTDGAEELPSAVSAELAEGEKPVFIKQADEEAEEQRANPLRQPQKFADQFQDIRGITSVHSFEGFRLNVAKVVTPTFFTSHNVMFPNSQFPQGMYQGVLTVLGDGDKFIRASMDHESNVSGEAHFPLGKGVQGKLDVQTGKQELSASYLGKTFSNQVAVGMGPALMVSYNQALTPHVTVGGEGTFSWAQQPPQLQYGFKYHTPGWECIGSLIEAGGGHMVLAQYVKEVVPGRVKLGAEYQAQLFNPEASQACVGAEFVLRQSKVSASVDSSGKVDSAMEIKLLTFLPTLPVTLMLSSSLDHSEDKAVFGLGLTLGQ